MTEPTVEQLREWAAMKVMGWFVYGRTGEYASHYRDTSNKIKRSWQPDRDRNQLAEVVMKWCGSEPHGWFKLTQYLISIERMTASDLVETIFASPELVLRALYTVVEGSE